MVEPCFDTIQCTACIVHLRQWILTSRSFKCQKSNKQTNHRWIVVEGVINVWQAFLDGIPLICYCLNIVDRATKICLAVSLVFPMYLQSPRGIEVPNRSFLVVQDLEPKNLSVQTDPCCLTWGSVARADESPACHRSNLPLCSQSRNLCDALSDENMGESLISPENDAGPHRNY